MGLPLMVLGAVWVSKGDGGAFLLSRAHRDSSRWQRLCRAHPPPTLPLSVCALRARGLFRSNLLHCHPRSSTGEVAARLSRGIFERSGALLGCLSGSSQASCSADGSELDVVDGAVTPHGPEQAS
jgi:hypothetical protein